MKLLHIDAGITGPNSVSRQLSSAIVEALAKADPTLEIVARDLDSDPIPHLDGGALDHPQAEIPAVQVRDRIGVQVARDDLNRRIGRGQRLDDGA